MRTTPPKPCEIIAGRSLAVHERVAVREKALDQVEAIGGKNANHESTQIHTNQIPPGFIRVNSCRFVVALFQNSDSVITAACSAYPRPSAWC
jgi:hypothetical protein